MPKQLTLQDKLRRLEMGETFVFLAGVSIPETLLHRSDFQINHAFDGGAVEYICLVHGGIEVST